MKTKRVLSVILLVSLVLSLLSPSVLADPGEEAPFSADCKAALLVEMNTGTVLYEKNAEEKVYPASLTKIMTCMLALEYGNLTDEVTVSASALEGLDDEGSTADLVVGETMTLENLLYCMMLVSANEACTVVAEYVSGSITEFVALMNQKAQELGCTGTHFANTHGLHEEDHYTTANDLRKIVTQALKNDDFVTITSAATYTVPATNKSEERVLSSTNFLINTTVTQEYYYAKAVGVKTGYTSAAGRCVISTASQENMRLLAIVLGADSPLDENGNLIYKNFIEAARLFDYGFDNFAYAQVLSRLQPIAQVPVSLSSGPDEVVLVPEADINCLLPIDYDADKITATYVPDSQEELQAPLEQGQAVGKVVVYYDGQEIGSVNALTLTAVEGSDLAAAYHRTKTFTQTYWYLFVLLGLLVALLVFYWIIRAINTRRAKKAAMRRRRPGGNQPGGPS